MTSKKSLGEIDKVAGRQLRSTSHLTRNCLKYGEMP